VADAPQELRRRAAACLLNQIAEDDHQASTTIRTTYTEANANALRFIPMPPVGMRGMERCFFLPIREKTDDGSFVVSFDLFVLVEQQNCLAFRFEPADPPDHPHSYTHVQLCTKLVRKTLILNVLPPWMPVSYPAFPVSASGPVELFLAMATSVHGHHRNGLASSFKIFLQAHQTMQSIMQMIFETCCATRERKFSQETDDSNGRIRL